MTCSHRLSLVLLMFLCVGLTAAPGLAAPQLTVSGAWIRALPSKLPAGGYFTLRNGGRATARLTGASSPACGMLMLHKSETMSGMAEMEDVSAVDIPAATTLTFAPGGYHLMCTNPTSAVTPGRTVHITLQFADGTALQADFAVRDASGH